MCKVVKTKEEKREKREKIVQVIFTNLQYLVLISLLVGQCVVGANFYMGQFIYLFANIVASTRNFVLHRPVSDKVKDCCCTGVTIGLILFNYYVN